MATEKFLSYRKRAELAEAKLRAVADEAKMQVAKLGAHQTLFESALTVMLKHDLLDEWAVEVSKAYAAPVSSSHVERSLSGDVGTHTKDHPNER